MDRTPLIVVATGVVLTLVVIFAMGAPWGAGPAAPAGAGGPVDAAGLIAWVAEAEPQWTCERSIGSAPSGGATAAWEQTWGADGVRLQLAVERFPGAEEAQAGYDRMLRRIPQPLDRDRWGEGWSMAVFGTARGPAAVALRVADVAVLVRAEPVDAARADATRLRGERMAELVRAFVAEGR